MCWSSNANVHVQRITWFDLYISITWLFKDDWYLSDMIGTAILRGVHRHSSVMSVALIWSDNLSLIHITLTSTALTKSLTIPAMKVHSDIVSDISGYDIVAFTSVALTSVSLTWSLAILTLINIALTNVLWHDLKILAAINVTDKCDYDLHSGFDKVQNAALTSVGSGYQASLFRSTYRSYLVYHDICFQRWVLVE